MQTTPTEASRYVRSQKPTVQLRRPTCTELVGNPALIAQLVLSVSGA